MPAPDRLKSVLAGVLSDQGTNGRRPASGRRRSVPGLCGLPGFGARSAWNIEQVLKIVFSARLSS
jgi:hypothetical protein